MRKFNPLILVFSLLFLITFITKAQTTSSFTFPNVLGQNCGSANILFTNTSTGTIQNSTWDFGDGTSIVKLGAGSPDAHIYNTIGTYTVTLTVKDNLGVNVVSTNTVHVYKKPIPSFSLSDSVICIGSTINFKDLSTKGDGTINKYTWTYGDGAFITSAVKIDPSHTYASATSTSVWLEVTDDNGCHNITPKNITSSAKPVISFSPDKLASCTTPTTIIFTNTTLNATKFVWDLGIGPKDSSITSPQKTYAANGTYKIKLTAVNGGCRVTDSSVSITIAKVKADFTAPLSACPNVAGTFTLTNTSKNATVYSWDYGDGSPLTNSPTHFYATPGIKNITLTASNPAAGAGCNDVITKPITVTDVVADFTVDNNYSCKVPLTVNFTDNSSGADSYAWDYGDGNNGITVGNNSHIYNTAGSFNPTLQVTNTASGCKATKTLALPIVITFPTIKLTVDTNRHCIPMTSIFTGTVVSKEAVTNWAWDFGDGNTATTPNTATNKYAAVGSVNAGVTITNASGCTATDKMLMQTGKIDSVGFILPDSVCAFKITNLVQKSKDSTLIDEFLWSFFANNTIVGTDPSKDPNHMFLEDTGSYNIKLRVGYNGCRDSLTKKNILYVNGPIITTLTPIANCTKVNNKKFQFVYSIKQAHRWNWDFNGEGTLFKKVVKWGTDTSVTNDTVTFTFASYGPKTITLHAVNDSCMNGKDSCYHDKIVNIFVTDPQAIITKVLPNTTCPKSPILFDASTSVDAVSYKWDWGNGVSSPKVFGKDTTYSYPLRGRYEVTLTITDVNGCTSSKVYDSIRIFHPKIDLTTSFDTICPGIPILFTDKSIDPDTLLLTNKTWDFVDGTTPLTTTNASDSHTFTKIGIYNVHFTITDKELCTADTTKQIIITKPYPNVLLATTKVCLNDSLLLNAIGTTSNYPVLSSKFNYQWKIKNGAILDTTIVNNIAPTYHFKKTGTYNIQLTVSDKFGCDSVITLPTIEVIKLPAVGITASDTVLNCYPANVFFTDTSTSIYKNSWNWDFGFAQSTNPNNAQMTFPTKGKYTVTLTVAATGYGSAGCPQKVVLKDFITVNGPEATFSISQDSICKGDTVTFNILTSKNATKFYWEFYPGKGIFLNGTESVKFKYDIVGTINPNVSFYDVSGSNCKVTMKDTIYVRQVISDFTLTDTLACINPANNFVFSNTSQGYKYWVYDFGDGNKDSTSTPITNHTYVNAGTYNAKLTVMDAKKACVQSKTQTILTYSKPPIKVLDTTICESKPITIITKPAVYQSYDWSPALGLSSITGPNPIAKPSQSTNYIVTVTDKAGCINYDTASIKVIPDFTKVNPVISLNTALDSIIIGDTTINFLVTLNPDVPKLKYTWTPTDWLSCSNCRSPKVVPLYSKDYQLEVTDTMGCFTGIATYFLKVRREYTLDIPTAFTPDDKSNNGKNSKIYAQGWGLESLEEFKIYNRWGQLVYDSPDIKEGWDGTFNGIVQNMDTYVYIVRGKKLGKNETITKKGYITLIR